MSSGLNWSENYYNPLGQTAEAYYGNDLKELMFGLEPIEEPGVTFGTTVLALKFLRM